MAHRRILRSKQYGYEPHLTAVWLIVTYVVIMSRECCKDQAFLFFIHLYSTIEILVSTRGTRRPGEHRDVRGYDRQIDKADIDTVKVSLLSSVRRPLVGFYFQHHVSSDPNLNTTTMHLFSDPCCHFPVYSRLSYCFTPHAACLVFPNFFFFQVSLLLSKFPQSLNTFTFRDGVRLFVMIWKRLSYKRQLSHILRRISFQWVGFPVSKWHRYSYYTAPILQCGCSLWTRENLPRFWTWLLCLGYSCLAYHVVVLCSRSPFCNTAPSLLKSTFLAFKQYAVPMFYDEESGLVYGADEASCKGTCEKGLVNRWISVKRDYSFKRRRRLFRKYL